MSFSCSLFKALIGNPKNNVIKTHLLSFIIVTPYFWHPLFAKGAKLLPMRKEKESIINGIKFKVTQLGFADGMELLTTLGRIVGPAISAAKKVSSSTAIIGDIISRLSFPELASITDKLARTTRIEREPGKWPVLEPEV